MTTFVPDPGLDNWIHLNDPVHPNVMQPVEDESWILLVELGVVFEPGWCNGRS
jgi:hypothetical protein